MAISTKINSTGLSYLSVITNKTVEMIAMKIFRFVEVATLSHRREETGGFFKVLRGDRRHQWGVFHRSRISIAYPAFMRKVRKDKMNALFLYRY